MDMHSQLDMEQLAVQWHCEKHNSNKAAIILIQLIEKGYLYIHVVNHRPKEYNDLCGGFSRGIINPALDLTKRSYCEALVNLMSTVSKFSSTDDFLVLLDNLDSWLLRAD